MTTITLTRTGSSLLQAAAANEGYLHFPATMKPASRTRLLGRLVQDGVVTDQEMDAGPHRLTAAGYQALGIAPPEKRPTATACEGSAASSKKAQVLAMLERNEGATLGELIAATGWQPHTVRAALSRIRSGGQALVKTARPDTAMAYHIPNQGVAAKKRRMRSAGKASAPTTQASDDSAPVATA